MTTTLPAARFQFIFLVPGFAQTLDHWMGYASAPMITDDFGNGIEMGDLPFGPLCHSLADV